MLDADIRRAAVERARERAIVLPTFAQLAGEEPIPQRALERLADVDPDAADPSNLWRVNWFNDAGRRGRSDVPSYVVLPAALTGVRTPIVVLLGARFPMIGAHKVLPAYAGLVTQLVSGRFNPDRHRAIWPSTGNYCRGGVAISRILGCAGVAVLPEGMSRERYEWLERWVADPSHIVRTVGTESNVKEIYDKCHELALSDENVILNQFSAFPNYLAHHVCTGGACDRVFFDFAAAHAGARLAAFVSATGSAGTIAAGDRLKSTHGTRIAAVEAVECPTLLENGYGEHNIQGIGDKHVPLIHNVMNLDFVIGISDRSTDLLNLLFNADGMRFRLARRFGLEEAQLSFLDEIGISGIANILAAIRLAKYMDYGSDDVVMTIATDGAGLYRSELETLERKEFGGGISDADIAAVLATHLGASAGPHLLETDARERRRIFNLGYYTWVEQQGVTADDFEARRDQSFWRGVAQSAPDWDALITSFNAEVGLN
ncbi:MULTISPECIES: pyridoxal-phosphate dependent enzyme [unclassified Mesorhizobium]|uniref:pyridoxal-phosphate dependent enzyme n=1 Tax=unclassified Mesorhizobium TaxID=325217 RepID=UPI001CCDA866|nr:MULTISPECIES: pyridoxal-phosphate dependent enzyme [unclassified Mesorhizobium]MBZ9810983.1 pyridoxal-phosphate dependent enzyme [Mesorhizobium sp. ESP-6-2]